METSTTELSLPISKKKVVIKTWITARDAEYIDAPTQQAVKMKAAANGQVELGDVDMSKITESNHRLLEKFVVSLDGSEENLLERIPDLPEVDADELTSTVQSYRKKKEA